MGDSSLSSSAFKEIQTFLSSIFWYSWLVSNQGKNQNPRIPLPFPSRFVYVFSTNRVDDFMRLFFDICSIVQNHNDDPLFSYLQVKYWSFMSLSATTLPRSESNFYISHFVSCLIFFMYRFTLLIPLVEISSLKPLFVLVSYMDLYNLYAFFSYFLFECLLCILDRINITFSLLTAWLNLYYLNIGFDQKS